MLQALNAINTTIDSIQSAKTTFVKTFIKDETFAKPLQAYVDTQTAFVKQAAKTSYEVGQKLTEDAVKYDYAKMFNLAK